MNVATNLHVVQVINVQRKELYAQGLPSERISQTFWGVRKRREDMNNLWRPIIQDVTQLLAILANRYLPLLFLMGNISAWIFIVIYC